MEKDFYRDEFEHMLKDTTQDFRMYPSRKVWHSLYNDLHPDRKWPSLAVCLVLLTAILHIGVSNNNTISRKSNNLMVESLVNGDQAEEKTASSTTGNIKQSSTTPVIAIKSNTARNLESNATGTRDENNYEDYAPQTPADFTNMGILSEPAKIINIASVVEKQNTELLIPSNVLPVVAANQEDKSAIENNTIIIDDAGADKAGINTELALALVINPDPVKTSETNKLSGTSDKEWVEDFAFHNKPKRNALKARLSTQYYITPSIGYRDLFKNHDHNPANGLLQRTTQNSDDITQQAALNLEAGAALLLDMNKKLRFKAGVQVNYSNYYTYAHELQHPTQTTVLLNNVNNNTLMPVSYSSTYGNVLGSNLSRLSNKVVQLSIPLGADYKLAGTNNVKWYIGATVQPTYISSGDAYLISADYKNFASDESMLDKLNLNTSLETFVSFKMPSGTFITLGPQVRYQLLSTYKNQYSYTEKRYNLGFKIGLSKKF